MSLHTSNLYLAGVPALTVHAGSREEALSRGTVLLLHGLGASKEVNAPELERLARRGLFAVGLDAVGHGQRRFHDFDERFSVPEPLRHERILEVVRGTAREVPGVLDALIQQGAHPERLGMAGISLGGYITYAAVLEDRRLRTATPLLASPQWWLPWAESPHLRLEHFFPVALFSQNAGVDELVSPGPTRELHARLEPYYTQAPHRLRYREFPHSGHFMLEGDWNEAFEGLLDWHCRFLAEP